MTKKQQKFEGRQRSIYSMQKRIVQQLELDSLFPGFEATQQLRSRRYNKKFKEQYNTSNVTKTLNDKNVTHAIKLSSLDGANDIRSICVTLHGGNKLLLLL